MSYVCMYLHVFRSFPELHRKIKRNNLVGYDLLLPLVYDQCHLPFDDYDHISISILVAIPQCMAQRENMVRPAGQAAVGPKYIQHSIQSSIQCIQVVLHYSIGVFKSGLLINH